MLQVLLHTEFVFKNADEQFKHIQDNQNKKNSLTSDNIHRFHQIFHIWISIYNYCKKLTSTS